MNIKALKGLTVEDELREIEAVFGKKIEAQAIAVRNRAYPKGVVKLKRSFNQFGARFWRVTGPAGHPNYQSDLSVLGLKEWGILPDNGGV